MKKKDVKIGTIYAVKVSGKISPVKILCVNQYGGWDAVNTKTNRNVRLRTAGRLRYEVLEKLS